MTDHESNVENNTGKSGVKTAVLRGRKPRVLHLMKYQPEVYKQILTFIRGGAYDYIAAEAAGVTSETWARWLARGAEARHGTPLRQFHDDVMQARAQARAMKEIEVAREDPKFWLRCGPGKTRQGRDGWTENVAIVGDAMADPISHEEHVEIEGHMRLTVDDAPVSDLAQALLILQQYGLTDLSALAAGNVPTPQIPRSLSENNGAGVTAPESVVDSVPVDPHSIDPHDVDLDGIDDDDDDYDDGRTDKGYNPFASTPFDQIDSVPDNRTPYD